MPVKPLAILKTLLPLVHSHPSRLSLEAGGVDGNVASICEALDALFISRVRGTMEHLMDQKVQIVHMLLDAFEK